MKNNKKVTLSLDKDIHRKYADYCEKNAFILSKKIEIFMRKELEGIKKSKNG